MVLVKESHSPRIRSVHPHGRTEEGRGGAEEINRARKSSRGDQIHGGVSTWAGPRDGDAWRQRLKEEYRGLIAYASVKWSRRAEAGAAAQVQEAPRRRRGSRSSGGAGAGAQEQAAAMQEQAAVVGSRRDGAGSTPHPAAARAAAAQERCGVGVGDRGVRACCVALWPVVWVCGRVPCGDVGMGSEVRFRICVV